MQREQERPWGHEHDNDKDDFRQQRSKSFYGGSSASDRMEALAWVFLAILLTYVVLRTLRDWEDWACRGWRQNGDMALVEPVCSKESCWRQNGGRVLMEPVYSKESGVGIPPGSIMAFRCPPKSDVSFCFRQPQNGNAVVDVRDNKSGRTVAYNITTGPFPSINLVTPRLTPLPSPKEPQDNYHGPPGPPRPREPSPDPGSGSSQPPSDFDFVFPQSRNVNNYKYGSNNNGGLNYGRPMPQNTLGPRIQLQPRTYHSPNMFNPTGNDYFTANKPSYGSYVPTYSPPVMTKPTRDGYFTGNRPSWESYVPTTTYTAPGPPHNNNHYKNNVNVPTYQGLRHQNPIDDLYKNNGPNVNQIQQNGKLNYSIGRASWSNPQMTNDPKMTNGNGGGRIVPNSNMWKSSIPQATRSRGLGVGLENLPGTGLRYRGGSIF